MTGRGCFAALGVSLVAGCASSSGAKGAASTRASTAERRGDVAAPSDHREPRRLTDLLSRPPDMVLTVHPQKIGRDAVYGPLFRRASELASAYAGPANLGTTALAVVERTDEVVVASIDAGREAVVVMNGVPAEIDPLEVVDASGHPLWRLVHGDVRSTTRELEPAEPMDAALFLAPDRVWIIATGPAIPRTRSALVDHAGTGAFTGDETSLASLALPGDAVPQLRRGSLATVGAGLLTVKVELSPGSVGLIVATLGYVDPAAAASAEGTVLAVTLAFRHRLEAAVDAPSHATAKPPAPQNPRPAANLDWLGAAKGERAGNDVLVRAPIPRPWLDALSRAEVPAPSL